MKKLGPVIVTMLIVGLVLLYSSVFVIYEGEQAIVLELGKHRATVTEAGLHFKKPFIQDVVLFQKRLLEYDAAPRELITGDKQQIVVDNYSRWKIIQPLVYYNSVRTENVAQSRLDDIIYSVVREKLGRLTRREIISKERSTLLKNVVEECRKKAQYYGIEIVDVRIKRADLPRENERNVFDRMRAEREREAKKYRAEGEEEARKIRSEAQKVTRIIEADAKKESEILKVQGDARATKIYAAAYNLDPDFYAFVRSLDSYEKVFDGDTQVILSPGNEFLQTFQKGR